MRITKVEAIPVWASFADVFGGADNVPQHVRVPAFGMTRVPLEGQGAVIVRVYTDEGIVGVGECMGRPGARSHAAVVTDTLAPILVGEDPLASARLYRQMFAQLDFAPMPISGVDLALWDIRGRYLGVPVYRLVGGPLQKSVACYASPVPYRETPEESALMAADFASAGFAAIKLKVGRGVARDLDHVAAVRASIGPDVSLMVDANGAYRLHDALELGRALSCAGVHWYEEPVHFDHVTDLATLRRKLDVQIVTGEWFSSSAQFRDVLKAEAADVLMPNITRCGGMTGFLEIAALAAANNVSISPHGVGGGVGMVAALHGMMAISNGLTYEYNQLANPLRHGLLERTVTFEDGRLAPPSGNGLGAELVEDILTQYSLATVGSG